MIQRISTGEAAVFLGVTEARVRALCARGTLAATKVPNDTYRGEWKIDKASVIRYAASRRKVGRPKTK